jgi:hypothetical protein
MDTGVGRRRRRGREGRGREARVLIAEAEAEGWRWTRDGKPGDEDDDCWGRCSSVMLYSIGTTPVSHAASPMLVCASSGTPLHAALRAFIVTGAMGERQRGAVSERGCREEKEDGRGDEGQHGVCGWEAGGDVRILRNPGGISGFLDFPSCWWLCV